MAITKNQLHRNTKKSFYDACIENNRTDLLKRWDYLLNGDPSTVAYHSKNVIHLKCPCGKHESASYRPDHIFNDAHCRSNNQPCPRCNSFAQWGVETYGNEFLDEYWDYDKNEHDPWILPKKSNKTIWIKCSKVDYHPSYDVVCSAFTNGSRCPYCKGFRLVPEDSIATKNPEVVNLWSEKNGFSAYDISPSSHKSAWFKCELGKHEDYFRKISDSRRYEFRCPECSKYMGLSSYQKKTAEELNKYGYLVLHEDDCTLHPLSSKSGYKMKYDNLIPDIRLVVEVHGEQHYRKNVKFYSSMSSDERDIRFQDSRRRDREKKEFAIANGYTYLELPYKSFYDGTYVRRIQYAIAFAKKAVSA